MYLTSLPIVAVRVGYILFAVFAVFSGKRCVLIYLIIRIRWQNGSGF